VKQAAAVVVAPGFVGCAAAMAIDTSPWQKLARQQSITME